MARYSAYTVGTLVWGIQLLRWGYRTSPYGDYSRFNYLNTAPFPGLLRPYVVIPDGHHGKCKGCP